MIYLLYHDLDFGLLIEYFESIESFEYFCQPSILDRVLPHSFLLPLVQAYFSVDSFHITVSFFNSLWLNSRFIMETPAASEVDSVFSGDLQDTGMASSPSSHIMDETTQALAEEENKARVANLKAEERRRKMLETKRKNKKPETKAEREKKASELDDLLKKSAAFSDILTKKTKVLGRVGVSLDGKALGEHNLEMAKQPETIVGGTMRDYQLEGLTWMYEICQQGMSGILADEMGLGM